MTVAYGSLDRRMARADLIDFLNANPPQRRVSLDVTSYGASVGTGGDDTVALQAAFAAARLLASATSKGVELTFPPLQYTCTSELNLDLTYNVTLRGICAPNTSGYEAQTATLLFTLTGSGNAISARSSTGFRMEGLRVMVNSPTFTGTIVNCDGTLGHDTQHVVIERCHLTGDLATAAPAYGISLSQAIISVVRDSLLGYVGVGVLGIRGSGYSNVVTLDNVACYNLRTAGIKNGGEAWRVEVCTFEQSTTGQACGYTSDQEAVGPVTFDGCWFGDAVNPGVAWIRYTGSALNVRGCEFGIASAAAGAIQVGNAIDGSPVTGVVIEGNRFLNDYAIQSFGTGLVYNLVALGNRYQGTHILTDTGNVVRDPVILDGSGAGAYDFKVAGKLKATAGLGIGNAVAATTPGSVTKKAALYDSETGTLLGYVPIYGTIT